MNTIQLILLHTVGSVYEITTGQSFTQRVLIPKAIKFYKGKSYLYKGINRYLQWGLIHFLARIYFHKGIAKVLDPCKCSLTRMKHQRYTPTQT